MRKGYIHTNFLTSTKKKLRWWLLPFLQHVIRALALRVLKEILNRQPWRFKNYAELTIMKTLEAHKDPHKEVRHPNAPPHIKMFCLFCKAFQNETRQLTEKKNSPGVCSSQRSHPNPRGYNSLLKIKISIFSLNSCLV